MNIRLWLISAAGAAAIAATMAFAPITTTSAQEIAPADSAMVMKGHGHGQGQGTMAHDGSCDEANFVDADGDGVCDNAGANASESFVDADGDGVCDNMGSGASAGTGSQTRSAGGATNAGGQARRGRP